ncbi:hypothetical protein BCR36DRAFT_415769 [Piromyces finnis]|uniref:Uncharacterized protein n=1 Tax=Piromyces finnis TaxID=1754191 RepID=A0A1Y1UZ17_9FUNG|nr:hypothetical protein BCR36DRAFT_415769 [Piromyces finnis]|eukprot:ORX43146.1 hypothetical protein BCR36DRAFT_415769 [Piromyces finnis]
MSKKDTSSKKIIPLSPNEEKAYIENEERKKRILRLQQVRKQGKIISENRTMNYNSGVEGELKNLIKLIKAEWNKNHIKKVDNFLELKKLTKNYIGAAQSNAKIQRNEDVLKKEELLIKLYNERVKENERYIEARQKQCKESLEKIKDITNYIKNQYNAITISNNREKKLVDQFREKQRNQVFIDEDKTFISYKDNDKDYSKKRNYNDSSYHREYNVVRCNHENNKYNASEIAYLKLKQGQLNLKNNQKKLKESIRITKERYKKAIDKMNDEKQNDVFIQNMKTLENIDILRRKENIKNSIRDYENIGNGNINVPCISQTDKKDYCINYYTNKELNKIPQEVERVNKKEWKNVGVQSNSKLSRPLQSRNNIKKQSEKEITSNKEYKYNDYSVCDKNSIVNQEVIRKVLFHQYP